MMNDEEKYIQLVLTGDTSAYRHLVERYQTGLVIHCENILKDRQDAEDITQDAFIKAFTDLAKFDNNKGRFSTWLYRITTNLCLDSLRKNKKNIAVEDVEKYIAVHEPPELNEEEKEHIRDAVALLKPPRYVSIIRGYFWEGKSYQTLADEHHTTTGTIGTWLTRAKAQLKEELS